MCCSPRSLGPPGAKESELRDPAIQPALHEALWRAHAAVYEGKHVLIHCLAGIHRTGPHTRVSPNTPPPPPLCRVYAGVFAYALARLCGYSPEEAPLLLWSSRPQTLRNVNVGLDRLAIAEQIVATMMSSHK